MSSQPVPEPTVEAALAKARTEAEQLKDALERLVPAARRLSNETKRIHAQEPVRNFDETLIEVDSALAVAESLTGEQE